MPSQTTHARPGRVLAGFAAFLVALVVLLFAGSQWGSAQLTPKLGLDLEGGTQLVLTPVLSGQETEIQEEQLDQARDIISQRADAGGIAGAEVTTQGGRNIVVSMPGVPPQEVEDAIRRSSQLQFRPVLVVQPTGGLTPAPTQTPTGTPTEGATPTDGSTASPSEAATPAASPTTNSGPVPEGFAAEATATAEPTSEPTATEPGAPAPTAEPTSATDPAWITDELIAEFEALTCTSGDDATTQQDPDTAVVACRDNGTENVKRSTCTEFFLHFYVHLYLIDWNMPGSLYHNLNSPLIRILLEFSQHLEFVELGFIGRIRDTTGSQSVTQGECHVVFARHVDYLVEM